ncbi:hypothetical protein GGI15_003146 [Coemansia interrupta]|uniref:Uncharacterized protein n=1 Tax=Coemansia interrupta TaxID=1126814 RepID=A0A9W8LJG8_9FUNG|nr:hypothetical protein GGI15_003146 [Coemansia interrupta]
MGFSKPKKNKSKTGPDVYGENGSRDLDPTKVMSGGSKVAKRGSRNTADAPKKFQHMMHFMEMKKKNDETRRQQKEKSLKQQQKQKQKQQGEGSGNQVIKDMLEIMPGESMYEFNQRVKQKMENNMRMVNSKAMNDDGKAALNPSRDEGGESTVSKRTDRKRKNDAVRKQRKIAKKNKGMDSDDEEDTGVSVQNASAPKFGEQAQAPPIFKALPKEKFKKMVPLPHSKEAATAEKQKQEVAVKKMIQRTARLSPLERMQAKRKAKEEGGSAAEKRIMEAEREKAIRRYRMLRVARESAKNK